MSLVPAYRRQAYEHQMARSHGVKRLAFTAFTALATGALRHGDVGDVALLTVPSLKRLRDAGHESPETTVSGQLLARGVAFVDFRGTVW